MKKFPLYFIIIIIIGLICWLAGLIFKVNQPLSWLFWGIVIPFGLIVLFVFGRQFYWWITKKGDYKE